MADQKAGLIPFGLIPLITVPILIVSFSPKAYLPAPVAQSDSSIAPKARAILEGNCLACHGETRMSGLDLRQRDTTLKGGTRGPALVPGDPDASLFYKAVLQNGDLKMPMGRQGYLREICRVYTSGSKRERLGILLPFSNPPPPPGGLSESRNAPPSRK